MDNPAAPIPSTPPQPAVQPEVSSPVESQGRHWPLWLFGGIALLALGVALGVFSAKFFSQSPSPSQLTLTPSPTLLPIPTPTPDLPRIGKRTVFKVDFSNTQTHGKPYQILAHFLVPFTLLLV